MISTFRKTSAFLLQIVDLEQKKLYNIGHVSATHTCVLKLEII
jgi:hypothetical protein